MGKDKFTQRKIQRRLIRGEMVKRGIKGKDIAAALGVSEMAVSKGCATSPRIVAALIAAGVPERLFMRKVNHRLVAGATDPAEAAA